MSRNAKLVAFLLVLNLASSAITFLVATSSVADARGRRPRATLAIANGVRIQSGTQFCIWDTDNNPIWCVSDVGTEGEESVQTTRVNYVQERVTDNAIYFRRADGGYWLGLDDRLAGEGTGVRLQPLASAGTQGNLDIDMGSASANFYNGASLVGGFTGGGQFFVDQTFRLGNSAAVLNGIYTAAPSIDFANTASGACTTTTTTVSNVEANDDCICTLDLTFNDTSSQFCKCDVSAANTADVEYCNQSGAAVDPGLATYRIMVFDR